MQFNRYASGAIQPCGAATAAPLDRGPSTMRKLVVAAALAGLALPAHLHAQAAPPPTQLWQPAAPTPAAPKHPPRHLFISPSGEPFRGRNGFSAWFAQADADHDG